MEEGPNAVESICDEVQIGVNLAKIMKQCVTSKADYLGGQQQLPKDSGWFVGVIAAGPTE